MKTEFYITIEDFCSNYRIEESFVTTLQEYNLIDVKIVEQQSYIHKEELPKLEKMVRMYHDLGINLEGIEAIHYLLQRVEHMQEELNRLRNKLDRFKDF